MYCNYCAKDLVKGDVKFCSDEHKVLFKEKKDAGLAVPLQITPSLLVWCKTYDKIPGIIMKYKDKMSNINFGVKELIRYETPKGKQRKNTKDEPLF